VVKAANQALIETIEESLRIADEGKRARAEAGAELEQMEAELRRALPRPAPRRVMPRTSMAWNCSRGLRVPPILEAFRSANERE
jgi:FAD/FMN-containing dehydrogenase